MLDGVDSFDGVMGQCWKPIHRLAQGTRSGIGHSVENGVIFIGSGSGHNAVVGQTMSARFSRHSAFPLVLTIVAVCFLSFGVPSAFAELDPLREDRAKNLIVMIYDELDGLDNFGAGIIVFADSDRMYIATANHLVRGTDGTSAEDIRLKFKFPCPEWDDCRDQRQRGKRHGVLAGWDGYSASHSQEHSRRSFGSAAGNGLNPGICGSQ